MSNNNTNGLPPIDLDGPSSPQVKGAKRGHRQEPFFIGVAGGTASGKTTACELASRRSKRRGGETLSPTHHRHPCLPTHLLAFRSPTPPRSPPLHFMQIIQRLGDQNVTMLCQDSFYRDLSPQELATVGTYNFDIPQAFDRAALMDCINTLRELKPCNVPVYDFASHRRSKKPRKILPADVVIVEGILVLHMEEIRNLLNMKIFVDTDDDVRLARRIIRDVNERGRDVAGVIEQYTKFVKPAFDQYVAPSRRFADIVIPWQHGDNVVAIDLITEHIRMKLQQHDLRRIYPSLELIPSNFQIRGMHTIIRDRETTTPDFVFYADRLLRLVVEAGLGHLPFAEKTVVTPTAHRYVGVDFAKKLCGVSIIRSGESMENALRACCKGIKIGKILVHREKVWSVMNRSASDQALNPTSEHSGGDESSGSLISLQAPPSATSASSSSAILSSIGGTAPSSVATGLDSQSRLERAESSRQVEQEIVYEKLPVDIAERYVMLMDPILGSGKSASRALQVLLDKGVAENKILFLTLIAAPEGIHRVCRAFPRVKVITSEIDERMHGFHVVPGVGEFGDRYFCT